MFKGGKLFFSSRCRLINDRRAAAELEFLAVGMMQLERVGYVDVNDRTQFWPTAGAAAGAANESRPRLACWMDVLYGLPLALRGIIELLPALAPRIRH